MRLPGAVFRWLSAGILALTLAAAIARPVRAADTGTYYLTSYIVRLAPQNDGRVRITIDQTWQVTGGRIPWVTVGLPGQIFNIEGFGGAVSKVSNGSGNGFFGVRCDLDKDYMPGQSFRVQFTVLQSNLLERLPRESQWRIVYTPGWYDNGAINDLRIDLVSPVTTDSYTSISPPVTRVDGSVMTWEKFNLRPGEHYTIVVQNPDGSFLTAKPPVTSGIQQLLAGMSKGTLIAIVVIAAVIIFIVVMIIVQARKNRQAVLAEAVETEKLMSEDPNKKKQVEKAFDEHLEKKHIQADEQGRYYDRTFGDYITPAIWWAILSNQSRANTSCVSVGGGGSAPRGGGCACACVSCACACACACAGGGAAGCAKKGFHECRECIEKEKRQGVAI